MKKYLIVFAAAVVALASCTHETPVQKITINPNAIEKFYVGDTVRLGLTISPAEAQLPKGVNVVWLSSDTNVVQVVNQNGTITAVAPGEAIVKAVAGEFEAVCDIYANYEPLFWNVANLFYFPSTKSKEPLSDSIFVLEDSTKAKLFSVTFIAPNANDFSEDFESGEGLCLFADVAALFPIEGTEDEKSTIAKVGNKREIKLVTTEEEWKTTPFAALEGNLDPAEAGPIYQDFLEKYEAGDASAKPDWTKFKEKAISGAYIADAEFSGEGVSYSYIPDGLLKAYNPDSVDGKNHITIDYEQGTINYDLTVQWIVSGWWGLAINQDATSFSDLLLYPYELTPSAWVHYDAAHELGEFIEDEEEDAESAPRRSAARKSNNSRRIFLGKPVPFSTTEKVVK